VALPAALTAAIVGANELVQHLYIDVSSPIEPSGGATLILLAIGLVSIPPIARFAGPILAGVLALGLAWTTEWTVVVVLVAFELVALAVGARLPRGAKGAAIAGVAALGWAAHDWVLVAVAAAALAGVAFVVVWRRAKHPPVLAIIAAPIAAALAAAATAYAIGGAPGEWAAAPAGTVGLIGMGALLWRTASIASRRVLPWVLSAAMIVAPVLAQSFTAAGVSLLLIGVAWFALTILGVPEGKWFASIAATFGVALIAWGADLSAIEAYTLAPALCALALGAQWMRAKPSVPSLAALGPGLAILLVPSYIALLANPDSMARTAWLTLVMVVLALVGMNRRWFAPVAATAVTAILVAVLQVVVGTNLVFRLFAFLIVGTLLLVAASWFDKIKQLR
jgi:hypothetical protein